MTIGYRNGADCLATVDDAIDAHYSGLPVSFYISGNTVNSVTFFKDSGVWKMNFQINQGTYFVNDIFSPPAYIPPTCTMSSTSAVPETGIPAGFDYSILGALFAFSFSTVVALYFIGKSGGAIVNIFRPR
ncbi:hypothetical protein [Thiobacillus sp.]|uniref:hypothetical protein n=1 Tax=Thiobacillus sp. TaxID=924 RepID=UPI0025DF1F09|nr:hypothetical protein [Thiobacillus sp.]MBT9540268.1 hypothetical protein [Thiobacillus sp.]